MNKNLSPVAVLKNLLIPLVLGILSLAGCVRIGQVPSSWAVLGLTSEQKSNLGEVVVGKSGKLSLSIHNRGVVKASLIQVSAITAPFSFTTTCHDTLDPDAKCQVDVEFTPSQAGKTTLDGVITYQDGQEQQTLTVTVEGTGLSPASIAISNSPEYDFGVIIDGNSAMQTFILTNEGQVNAKDIALSDLAGAFSTSQNDCGATLAPGQSCQVQVQATPTDESKSITSFAVSYTNGVIAAKASTQLTVQGQSPASLTISEFPSYSFGNITVGAFKTKSFTITNQGHSVATNVAVDAVSSPFSISSTCGSTIAVGGSCTATLTYSPAGIAIDNTVVSLSYQNGVANQQTSRAVSGSGITVATLVVSDGPSFDFGKTIIGNTAKKTFSITNSGQTDATNVVFGGSAAPFTIESNSCGTTISASQSCSVIIDFIPTVTGESSSQFSFDYFNGASSQNSSRKVQGTGITPATIVISQSPTFDFGNVTVGNTITKVFLVNNQGQAGAANVSIAALGAPFAITKNTCGNSIAGGDSCQITISFAPSNVGENPTSQTSLTFNYQDGVTNRQSERSISGTAITPASLSISDGPTYDFGNVTIGNAPTKTFTINNSGQTDAISVSLASLTGVYGLSSTCGATIAASTSCSVTISFAPASAVSSTAKIVATYNDGFTNQQATRDIRGAGITPASLSISDGPTYDFGNVTVGNTGEKIFTVSNEGGTDATSVVLSSLVAPFLVKSTTCGTSIFASKFCTVTVDYTPTSDPASTAKISIGYSTGASSSNVSRNIQGEAITPASITISQSPSFDFGQIVLGNTVTQTFQIANQGQTTAAISSIPALSIPYSVAANTCGNTLAGSGSCQVTVSYAPSAAVTSDISLVVNYQDGVTSQQSKVNITGTGITSASLSFSNFPTLDFGSVLINGASSTKTITLTNNGQASATGINFTNIALPFSSGKTTCGSSLGGGQSCTIDLTYTADIAQQQNGKITVNYGNGISSISSNLALTGKGINPASLSLSVSSPYDFGNVIVGNSSSVNVIVTNNGDVSATNLSLTGLSAPYVISSTTCGSSISAGDTCQATVKYEPTKAGTTSPTLSVTYGNGLSTVDSALQFKGTGITPASLSLSDGPTYNFNSVILGNSAKKTFTVTNNGQAQASSITVATISAPFSITKNTCNNTLNNSASCQVEITFSPTNGVISSTTLAVSYSDGVTNQQSSNTVKGTGLGLAVLAITAPNGNANFGNVTVSNTADIVFTVTNTGKGSASNVSFPSLSAPFAIQQNNCTSSLAVNTSCTLTVRFSPTAMGSASNTLKANYNDGSSNQSASLGFSGSGTAFTVFVSSVAYTGGLGGLTGADERCQTLAEAQKMPGVWRAIVSDSSTNAADHISFNGPVYNRKNQLIAASQSILFSGSLNNPIRYNEIGADQNSSQIWTGSTASGTSSSFNCSNWTSSSGNGSSGRTGDSIDSNSDWINEGNDACNTQSRLYCINSTVNYSVLASFSVTTGTSDGQISLSINFPADTSAYDKVTILRSSGNIPPSCLSTTATSVSTITNFQNTSLTDSTGTPGLTYAYSACVTNSNKNVLTSRSGNAQAKGQVIFVTSQSYNGNLGGLTGADKNCAAVATAAGFLGTWKAIASDNSTNASDRISVPGAVYDTKGVIVATGKSDLWDGSVDHPILYDEVGTSTSAFAWTGTLSNGQKASNSNCSNWTSSGGGGNIGLVGDPVDSDSNWVDESSPATCNTKLRLYCTNQ